MPVTRITRKRTIQACVQCRQAKTKCDSVTNTQHPCTRCRLRGLECLVDEAFERMPVRQRLRAMTAELQQLRESARRHPISSTTLNDPVSGHGDADTAPDSQHRSYSLGRPTADPLQMGGGIGKISLVEPAVMGPLEMSVQDVEKTFKIYRERFHQHLPIMDLSESIGGLQQCSPFLFWTVVVIVQLRSSLIDDVKIRDEFVAVYSSLTKQWMLSSPLTLHDIQAILHLCVWPLPVKWQLSEPSILYTGIAINACGYLNLARSASKHIYQGAQLSAQNADIMSRTWLAAFCVSTAVALCMGVPPPIKYSGDIFGLQEHIRHPNVPCQLAAEAAMLSTLVKHQNLCANGADTAILEGLLELHTQEIDGIRQQYQTTWNDGLEIQYLFAKMHISVPLLLRQRSPAHTETSYLCLTTIATGKSFACSIIQVLGRFVSPTVDRGGLSSRERFVSLPKLYFRALCYAVFFLVRFGTTRQGVAGYDRRTREHIALAQELLTQASSQPHDEAERAVRLFERLLKAKDYFADQNPDIDEPERGTGALFWEMLRQSYCLRSWKINHTDLLRLINPTRSLQSSENEAGLSEPSNIGQDSGEQSYIADAANSYFWDESMRDIFDLNLFDMPGIIDTEGAQ